MRKYGNNSKQAAEYDQQQAEIRLLRAELERVKEKRDILEKATAYSAEESQ